eukprot:SAG11_NODE_37607_length_256_cov_0.656051_1_plen_75_part_10
MCTLEFETRQSKDGSYHWLNDALGIFHSFTWEYSRCSISHNVMSKRRLNRLVTDKVCRTYMRILVPPQHEKHSPP